MGQKKKGKKKNNKKKPKKTVVQQETKEVEEEVLGLGDDQGEKTQTSEPVQQEQQAEQSQGDSPSGGKKKRKRKKKAKKKPPRGIDLVPVNVYTQGGQTYPPSKRVAELYPADSFPVNQTMPHPNGEWRLTADEKIETEKDLAWTSRMNSVREASEIHRQVRQDAQRFIQPGMELTDICNYLESCNLRLLGFDPEDPLARSWGFPTGCSINECAAHYTPNPGDKVILKDTDIIKFDFGTQIDGHIIDCAWTMAFNPMHDTLMAAVKDATNTGIKTMGIDVRLGDVGAAIQEAMESYECEYDQKIYPVRCIENLSGHSIGPYKIHADNTVPIVACDDPTKMREGEMYAIETFGTTGRGYIEERGDCSHYMKNWDMGPKAVRHQGARKLLSFINKRFDTLAFCRRWVEKEFGSGHILALKRLVDADIVKEYPPLCDIEGCYTAQYEHTIVLRPTCKEIVSRGGDY